MKKYQCEHNPETDVEKVFTSSVVKMQLMTTFKNKDAQLGLLFYHTNNDTKYQVYLDQYIGLFLDTKRGQCIGLKSAYFRPLEKTRLLLLTVYNFTGFHTQKKKYY